MKAVKMKDAAGDDLTISDSPTGDWVILECIEPCVGTRQTQIALTPAQARRVAKALMKFAEGKHV